jgi:hypothetical protein
MGGKRATADGDTRQQGDTREEEAAVVEATTVV